MSKALIFVSCGQCSTEEKALGLAIKAVIDHTDGLESYFAESVHSLEALGRHIFEALRQCSGAVIVLHARGRVLDASGEMWGTRSSVWVNQELAVLAYRQLSESRAVPILAFVDASVKLEGAMTSLIVNPRTLGPPPEVVSVVEAWLSTTTFVPVSEDVVADSWQRLSESGRMVLACLLDAGGSEVAQMVLQRALMRCFDVAAGQVGRVINEAQLEFGSTGFASRELRTFGYIFSVHGVWEPELRRRVGQWRRAVSARKNEAPNPQAAPSG